MVNIVLKLFSMTISVLFHCVMFDVYYLSMFDCYCFVFHLQSIITEVNHAIGATGVVSQECKTVVSQYGETIIEMLLAKVYAKLLICH